MLSRIWQNFGKQTCSICKGTEGKVLRESKLDFYWSYHQECLKKVVCNPKEHPKWIRYAYQLTKVIEERKAREKKGREALKRLQPKYECNKKPQPPPDRLIREGEQPEKRKIC